MKIQVLWLAFAFSFSLFAAELPPEAKTSEATLVADYEQKVLPFFARGRTGVLVGQKNAKLAYRVFEVEKEKAAIVFVLGWTETAQKYAELFFNLTQSGYSVYVLDNRGQGLSSRLAPNPQMVHVDGYNDYVLDLKKFVDLVVNKTKHEKLFMLSHSMGGLIAALYGAVYPWDLSALVLSSPLLQVNTGSFPEWVAYRIAKTSASMGGAKSYILTHEDTTPFKSSDFTKQKSTHSRARWGKKVALWYQVPQSFMSGSSNRWLQRTIEATWWVQGTGAGKISVPVLVFTAGEDERVWNPGVDAACKAMPRCESHHFKNGYHELFLESDGIRDSVIQKMLTFFERN